MNYTGPERRKKDRPVAPPRSEVAMRLLLTTERLERLASRLEAHVDASATQNKQRKKP